MLGNEKPEALPILEWDFSKMPEGLPRIASSTAKWDEKSAYKDAPQRFPRDIPEAVYKRIQETAVQAFKSLKLRDYGRVDLRLRRSSARKPAEETKDASKNIEEGDRADYQPALGESTPTEMDDWEFFVIEVNPNPHLDIKSEFAMAAREHGLSFPGLMEKIIELAMERNP